MGVENHFLWRGPYNEPNGDTVVKTDYKLIVGSIKKTNLSVERDIISMIILGTPILFVVFIVQKKFKQRHI